jgi:hypothetical protein
MPRYILTVAVLLIALLLPLCAGAQEIKGPELTINDGHITVSTGLALSEEQVEAVSKGISKEITIYVDLFRVWKSWPDEFVLGAKFNRTLSCDPVKKEYVATSLHGDTLREKRFTDCDSLLKWALSIKDLQLTSTTELDPADYFVKVTAESRLRKLPPVVGYLFFFVKEKEFRIDKDSRIFPVNGSNEKNEKEKRE